jgi:hypothetical protein
MHLTGKANAADLSCLAGMNTCQIVDGPNRRIDPRIGILFRPERMWVRQCKAARGGRDDRASLVDQHSLDAGRADVDSKIHVIPPFRSGATSLKAIAVGLAERGIATARGKSGTETQVGRVLDRY